MYPPGTTVVGLHGHRYELTERVGEGGGGEVYKAHRPNETQLVAVKFMWVQWSFSVDILRFLLEAKIGYLDHPNIVQTIELGNHEGRPFIVMEYMKGGSARDRLLRDGVFSEEEALRITRDVARAVAHLEKHHIVHRDIKPGNIMLTPDGMAKLTDFGIAKGVGVPDLPSLPGESIPSDRSRSVTIQGQVLGTPEYMSPEQLSGEDVDTRSDIYSLGVSLYQVLTNRLPFKPDRTLGDEQPVRRDQGKGIMTERPADPRQHRAGLAGSTAELVLTMLNKEPFHRYPTADDLIRAINAILASILHPVLKEIFDALADPVLTQRAFVAAEIMGPPKALRAP